MPLSLSQILPNIASGLSNTGFIFGAGTSVEAGFPMMPGLTREVVGALHNSERGVLDEVLDANGMRYASTGNPNIEVISDLVMAHSLSTGNSKFSDLEVRLRQLITDVILGVTDPRLDNHVKFLEALKRRAFGQPASVYIFTTNYDILFELAGARAGVVVETGFVGSVERFFDHQRFQATCGFVQKPANFAEYPVLTVKLIKLHGSVSWLARDGGVFERHPSAINPSDKRIMILPRRRKVMDTLQSPHDILFGVVSRALGVDCKYLVSCGFSYGDEHINDNLLVPSVRAGKIRLFAFAEEETSGMSALKNAAAFNARFKDKGIDAGQEHADGSGCWMFSNFVQLFC